VGEHEKEKSVRGKKTSIPLKPLRNFELLRSVKELNIPNFRGFYMRDKLPRGGPRKSESGIVNLDSSSGEGTHWVAYRKTGNSVKYFDSFGNLRPPLELENYFGPDVKIEYNYKRKQNLNSVVCGHFCLKFLCNDAT